MTDPALAYRPFRLAEALVWAGVAACAAGIATTGLWRQLPAGRFAESLALAALVALPAWGLRRWRGWPWAGALAAAWTLLLAATVGALPMLAVALLATAALASGSLVAPGRPMLAVTCGLAMLAGAAGWLVLLPLHRWWTWLPLLGALAFVRRGAARGALAGGMRACREAVHAHPRAAAATVMLLGLASAAAWVPTLQYDDLAYHLALPWQLMLHGRYAPDPAQQVWAYAPWAGDVLQAIAQVVAHAEARGGVNALWLLATAAALCVAAGLAWQANASWVLHVGGPKRALLALGRDTPLFDKYAPERSLAAAIRAQAPGTGPVLLLSEPYQAEFAGRARNVAWYSPHMQAAAAAADRDPSGAAWAALLRREHIAEVILAHATLPAPRRAGLARAGAQRKLAAGDAEWWRIPSAKDAR